MMALKFEKRRPMIGEGGILHGKKVPDRRPFGVSVLPEARETRRFSANDGKNNEASSNSPCAPENKWGGDVHIMAAKKKTAKKTAKKKK
jgi:hypothetical protein